MKRKEKFNKKLLVEGQTDLYVIAEIRNVKSLPDNFDILDEESISKLIEGITPRLKSSGLEAIGIVVDADENLSEIWNSLTKKFKEISIELPNKIDDQGLILEREGVKIGIWIMPNNNLKGTLEDFLYYLIPQNDLLIDEVENHLQTIESKNLQKYNPNNRTKAKIHSWLALQESPGSPSRKSNKL